MSTVTTHDWDAGIRRERRLDGLLSLSVTAALAGYVLLCLDLPATAGRVWIVVGLLSLALFATQQWANGTGRRVVETFRLRHAVRERVDPGPQWRDQRTRRPTASLRAGWRGSTCWPRPSSSRAAAGRSRPPRCRAPCS